MSNTSTRPKQGNLCFGALKNTILLEIKKYLFVAQNLMKLFKAKYSLFGIILVIWTCILAWNFLFAQNSHFFVEPSTGSFTTSCTYPFQLKMDLGTLETTAIDAKMLLSWFIFDHIVAVDMNYVGYLSGMATSGTNAGESYTYINSYQGSDLISWDNITIGTLYLKVLSGMWDTGYIDFYFVAPNRNWDDSNIPIGLNSPENGQFTQFLDSLATVSGGIYQIISGSLCIATPYIMSGYYHQNTNIDKGTWYQTVSPLITAGYSFSYPGSYPGDNVWNDRVQNTWRTIRTNTAVILIITGDVPIQIMESSLSGLPITVLNNWSETISKTLIITWNINAHTINFGHSWAVGFEFIYQSGGLPYTGTFYIDVFWISQTAPIVSGNIILSGSDAIVNFHSLSGGNSRTNKDDEFKIIEFSGYQVAPTNYFDDSNNLFWMQQQATFTGIRSWWIVYIDRAYNTGMYFLDLQTAEDYIVKAYPQGRLVTSSTPNPNLATIGTVNIYTMNKVFVTSSSVTTNNKGTGIVEFPSLSGVYYVTFQWLSHLQSVISGIVINDTQRIIDFSSWSITRRDGMIKNDLITFDIDYQNIWGYVYLNILDVQILFGFPVQNGFNIETISDTWTIITQWIERTGLNLGIMQTGNVFWDAGIENINATWFTFEFDTNFFSWEVNITNSWVILFSTWYDVISVEIAWEVVKDTEINGVDSSVLIQYITNNGPTNTNTGFGYELEDLNANGQVDAADITVLGYNLYRRDHVIP